MFQAIRNFFFGTKTVEKKELFDGWLVQHPSVMDGKKCVGHRTFSNNAEGAERHIMMTSKYVPCPAGFVRTFIPTKQVGSSRDSYIAIVSRPEIHESLVRTWGAQETVQLTKEQATSGSLVFQV